MVRRMEHHAAIEVSAADCSRDTWEDLGVLLLEQLQSGMPGPGPVRPHRVNLTKVYRTLPSGTPLQMLLASVGGNPTGSEEY